MAYIETDSLKGGEAVGESVAKTMGGKGKILVTSFSNIGSGENRELGFAKALKKYPEMKVVKIPLEEVQLNISNEDAYIILVSAIRENPDFDAIYTLNSLWGEAAANYLRKINSSKKVFTFDCSSKIINYIKEGYVTAAFAQRPFIWGEKLVKWIYDSKSGREIPQYEDTGLFEVIKNNYSIFKRNFKQ